MLLAPTPALIESQDIVEGRDYEFKQQVDFTDARQKSNFVDDVVAFLNAETPGHILVGVKEKGGVFAGYSPLLGDPDQLIRRVLSLLQDNIDPRPLNLDVRALAIEGGIILDVAIGAHRMGPYQNTLTGAFYRRTGAKNTPLRRDELGGHFISRDRYDEELLKRMDQAARLLDARDVMSSSGVALDIGVLPRERFDRGRAPFEQSHGVLKMAPGFHHGRRQPFRGAEDGFEAIEIDLDSRGICRVLVADDWFIHARVIHPFATDGSGRVKLYEFKDELTAFLGDIEAFARSEGLRGPFAVQINAHRLRATDKTAWFFERATAVSLARPAWSEAIADPETIDQLHRRLVSVSVHG